MPRFCQKHVHSLKNTMLSCNFFLIFHEKHPSVMPIFGKKTSILSKLYYILSKSQCSLVIKKKNHEKPPPVMPMFGQNKRQLCQNDTILWAKKVNRMPFFSDFSGKKSLLSRPYFVKKTSIF